MTLPNELLRVICLINFRTGTNGLTGGGRRIRTFEALPQQIYSLPPLTTWVSHQISERRSKVWEEDYLPRTNWRGLAKSFLHSVDWVRENWEVSNLMDQEVASLRL